MSATEEKVLSPDPNMTLVRSARGNTYDVMLMWSEAEHVRPAVMMTSPSLL